MTSAQAPAGVTRSSTVEIDGRVVDVRSVLLLDPEAMIVTTVSAEGAVVQRSHAALPRAAVGDVAGGTRALGSTLQAYHLRFVQRLVAEGGAKAPASPGAALAAGVLATLELDAGGAVAAPVGEDQVPGDWLRAAYLASGMGEVLGEAFGLGPAKRVVLAGDHLGAVMLRDGSLVRIAFVDPTVAAPSAFEGLVGELRELRGP